MFPTFISQHYSWSAVWKFPSCHLESVSLQREKKHSLSEMMLYNLFFFFFFESVSRGEYNKKKQSSKTKFRQLLPGWNDPYRHTPADYGIDASHHTQEWEFLECVCMCVSLFLMTMKMSWWKFGEKKRKEEVILTPSIFQSKSPGKMNQLFKDVFHQRVFWYSNDRFHCGIPNRSINYLTRTL